MIVELDLTHAGCSPMAGFCRYGTDPSGSVNENFFTAGNVISVARRKLHNGIGRCCVIRDEAVPSRHTHVIFKLCEEVTCILRCQYIIKIFALRSCTKAEIAACRDQRRQITDWFCGLIRSTV